LDEFTKYDVPGWGVYAVSDSGQVLGPCSSESTVDYLVARLRGPIRHYFRNDLTEAEVAEERKWIAALRSGDYKQGRGRLCEVAGGSTRSHCCLGVRCEVGGLPVEQIEQIFTDVEGRMYLAYRYGASVNSVSLPQGFGGLRGQRGDPRYAGHHPAGFRSLAGLNDDGLATFAQVADILELDLAGELTKEAYNGILGSGG